jgi:hypothetical protein
VSTLGPHPNSQPTNAPENAIKQNKSLNNVAGVLCADICWASISSDEVRACRITKIARVLVAVHTRFEVRGGWPPTRLGNPLGLGLAFAIRISIL